jgi:hypothetical protein
MIAALSHTPLLGADLGSTQERVAQQFYAALASLGVHAGGRVQDHGPGKRERTPHQVTFLSRTYINPHHHTNIYEDTRDLFHEINVCAGARCTDVQVAVSSYVDSNNATIYRVHLRFCVINPPNCALRVG